MPPIELHLTHRSLVMITGATGGLGKAFAVECASRGWDLFLTDLSAGALETLAAGLRSGYGVRVLTYACDLADPASRAGLFEYIRGAGLPRAKSQDTPPLAGGVQFWSLINVAGIDYEGPFYEQTSQQIRTILRLNIEATLEMTHSMLEFRDPVTIFHIINVASLAAFYPMPAKATYAASKRFLLDFSLALRQEVRSLGAIVTVLCPAGLPTTPECIAAIEAQGWMGHVTTCDVGRVADETLDAALAGRGVVIPGWVNRLLQVLGGLAPAAWVIGLVGSRWKAAQQKREWQRQGQVSRGESRDASAVGSGATAA